MFQPHVKFFAKTQLTRLLAKALGENPYLTVGEGGKERDRDEPDERDSTKTDPDPTSSIGDAVHR